MVLVKKLGLCAQNFGYLTLPAKFGVSRYIAMQFSRNFQLCI